MPRYIYQSESWPHLTWHEAALAEALGAARLQQGRILGRLDALGFVLRQQTALGALTDEILRSSEIEGEHLDEAQVRSSVARNLGIEQSDGVPPSHHVEGVVELMLDATRNFAKPLTRARLCAWHAALFPTGRSGLSLVHTGAYRNDEMQIVSGAFGREKVHYEAPAPERVPAEMKQFLSWLNASAPMDGVLKAGVAHFRFIIIHPFDDGNGRLARAITEMLLARSDGYADRYFSLSDRIMKERKDYYAVLKSAQHSKGDITEWLTWYLGCLNRALEDSAKTLEKVVTKADFWAKHADKALNARQQRMLNALFDGFEGKLTTAKWAKITKTSHDTALRDIKSLIGLGLLRQEVGGSRNTSYCIDD
jgi:Fic family protein